MSVLSSLGSVAGHLWSRPRRSAPVGSLETMNTMMVITGVRLPSTSRFFKPSASEFIMVRLSRYFVIHILFTHFATGKFVSESKFVSNPSAFIPHIQTPNRAALEALITKPEVEQRLLQRLRKKAATYAQDFAADGEAVVSSNGSAKIDVDGVVELYESYIIPLTKEVEVGPSTPHGISLD